MKIGILGAMDQEVALLKDTLNNATEQQIAHLTFYSGTLNGIDIVLVKCGIGKVAAAVATTILIHHFGPDYVVNTGSAGGFDTSLSIGDIVIGNGVQHHDVDITHFGYELGQAVGMPTVFECDDTLVNAAEEAAAETLAVKTIRGLICTGDAFIGSDEAAARLRESFPAIGASEMEGAAIAQASYMLDTPFLVIRSLSDIAGKTSTVSFNTYLETAAKNSAELVIAMTAVLAKRQVSGN